MANSSNLLDWCIVRLGEDHNWWVDEVSDPVRWDVDGLSIVDPRQVAHLLELVEPLRDYGFDEDVLEAAFVAFRIEKEAGEGRVRLKRVKDSLAESDEKLFALPDVLDEENGPYSDLLDHVARCRVKLLNDIFEFESKLTIDEVEDELREEQNASFIEGKAVHCFDELCSILEYTPAGWDTDADNDERAINEEDIDDADLPDIDDEDEEALKGDESLKWDEDEEEEEEEENSDGEEEEESDEDKDDGFGNDSDEEGEDDEGENRKRPSPKNGGSRKRR